MPCGDSEIWAVLQDKETDRSLTLEDVTVPTLSWALTVCCAVFCLALRRVSARRYLHDCLLHDAPLEGMGSTFPSLYDLQ